jgi:hypothetical protein
MPVTDQQYATLRALLTGDFDLHRNLRSQLTQDADSESYSALIAAAFFLAADKRFARHHTTADIVEFVASARSTSEDAAKGIDPLLAERMIRGVFEDESVDGVSGQIIVENQVLLLAALVSEARLDENGVDQLLNESRVLADRWTS